MISFSFNMPGPVGTSNKSVTNSDLTVYICVLFILVPHFFLLEENILILNTWGTPVHCSINFLHVHFPLML